MKRLTLAILGLLILHNTAAADIVKTISKYTFETPFILFNYDHYYCELYISDDKDLVLRTWGELLEPGILAYKINSDTITLILKDDDYEQSYRKIKYIYVELKEVKGDIISKYHEINTINLDGFTINDADFVGTKVNIMQQPSFNSALYVTRTFTSKDDKYVKVTGIKNPREKTTEIADFWYEIEYENKKLWVYGYYLYFLNAIILEETS
jgi:hypothetical protein